MLDTTTHVMMEVKVMLMQRVREIMKLVNMYPDVVIILWSLGIEDGWSYSEIAPDSGAALLEAAGCNENPS